MSVHQIEAGEGIERDEARAGEIYLGSLEGRPCYAATHSDPAKAPAGLNFQEGNFTQHRPATHRLVCSFSFIKQSKSIR